MKNVIALFSPKGGVGKTTTAVNLAASAAMHGQRTLLIDLDPQGASSHLLRIRPSDEVKTRRFWNGTADYDDLIRASDIDRLDILPATDALRRTDSVLEELNKPKRRLEHLLAGFEGWDLVVLDCPPGLGLLSENIVRASHLVLVPVAPSQLALRTLAPLAALAKNYRDRLRPFLSMVRGRCELTEQLHSDWPSSLSTVIPASTIIEQAALVRLPVVVHSPRSRVALAYRALLKEVMIAPSREGKSPNDQASTKRAGDS